MPAECPELGLEVPVAEIDKALHKLWEQDQARTNATLMNLVVYSEKPGSLRENSLVVQEFMQEHACRAILVEIAREIEQPSLRAWITAHCHLRGGRKSVCCEQIAFYLTGKVTGRFRNTVFAHLNSDLPLVFWWQGELSELFTERLLNIIDRLSIDSSQWSDPLASYRMIQERIGTNANLILHDLEWTRSLTLRLSVASMFDHPAVLAALPDVDALEITHAAAHRNAALMLLAWVAKQAEWQRAADGLFLSKNGKQIRVKMTAQGDAAISSLSMSAGTRQIEITRHENGQHWQRNIIAPNFHQTTLAPLGVQNPQELVADQLSRGGKNSLFQKILPTYLELLAKGG